MGLPEDYRRPETPPFRAWRGVLFASARILRVAEIDLLAREGIALTWLDVLGRLYDAGADGLRMQELQERSLFTNSGMTRLVDRMEDAGLVRREAVAGDRRGVRVLLTDAGIEKYVRAIEDHVQLIDREFGGRLTDDQLRAVTDALAGFMPDVAGEPAG